MRFQHSLIFLFMKILFSGSLGWLYMIVVFSPLFFSNLSHDMPTCFDSHAALIFRAQQKSKNLQKIKRKYSPDEGEHFVLPQWLKPIWVTSSVCIANSLEIVGSFVTDSEPLLPARVSLSASYDFVCLFLCQHHLV